jgi:hypothetical protein
MVPTSATTSTKGTTILARNDRRMSPTTRMIEQGACARR